MTPLTIDEKEALRISINISSKIIEEHILNFKTSSESEKTHIPIYKYFLSQKVELINAGLKLGIIEQQKTMHS